VLAVVLGLHWWPAIDTSLGYAAALMIVPAVYFTTSDTRLRMALLLAIGAAVCCVAAVETFGTVLHNKGWGPIYGAIPLIAITIGSPVNNAIRLLLLIAPFTGTVALFLLAIWAAGLVVTRHTRLIKPLVYCIPGLLFQVAYFLLPSQPTGMGARPITLYGIFLIPDLTLKKLIAAVIWPKILTVHLELPGLVELVICAIIFASVIFWMLWAARSNPLWLIVPSGIGTFTISALLALGGVPLLLILPSAFRYYFPPLAVCLMGLTALVANKELYTRVALGALSVLIVSINVGATPASLRKKFWETTSPSWQDQLRATAPNPPPQIAIYPDNWFIRLPPCGEYHC